MNATPLQLLLKAAGFLHHVAYLPASASCPSSSKAWSAIARLCRACSEDMLQACNRCQDQETLLRHQQACGLRMQTGGVYHAEISPCTEAAATCLPVQSSAAHCLQSHAQGYLGRARAATVPLHSSPAGYLLSDVNSRGFSSKSGASCSSAQADHTETRGDMPMHPWGGDEGRSITSPQGSSTQLAHVIARLKTLREAEELLVEQRNMFRAEHVAQLVARLPDLDLEFANAHYRLSQLLKLTGDAVCKTRAILHGPELAGCIIAYARLRVAPPGGVVPLLHSLCVQPGAKLRQCNGGDLCSLAWALSRLQGLYGSALHLTSLEFLPEPRQQEHQQRLAQGSAGPPPTSYPPSLHAQAPSQSPFVTEDGILPAAWDALCLAVLGKLKQTTGDDLAKLAWAMAKVQRTDLALLDAIATRVATVCSATLPMEEQDPAASGVQLMSKLAHLPFGQRRIAMKALQQRKREIRVREMAALKTAHKAAVQADLLEPSRRGSPILSRGDAGGPLLLAGSSQLQQQQKKQREAHRDAPGSLAAEHVRVRHLVPSPVGIANLAWAFLTLGQRSPIMLAALARAAVIQKADFTPSSLSTVLWAFAACGYYDRVMCNTLGRRAALSLKRMPLHEVSQVCWSLATLRHYEPLLTLRLAQVLVDRVPGLFLSNPTAAGSPLQAPCPSDHDRNHEEAPLSASSLSPESLTPPQAVNLLWSLAHMPPAATSLETSGLGPSARRAHTRSASLLCRALSTPEVLKSLSARDCVRALWSAAVLGTLPLLEDANHDSTSMRSQCQSLAPALLRTLGSRWPAQDLSEELLRMLHAAVQVVAVWGGVQEGSNAALAADGAHTGAPERQWFPGDGSLELQPSSDDEQDGSDEWQRCNQCQRQHQQSHCMEGGHSGFAEWQQQQQQQQQQPHGYAWGSLAEVKEGKDGIIDVSHVPPFQRWSTRDASRSTRAQPAMTHCLPEPLMAAARAAACAGAAARVRERAAGLWEHEAHRVAEAVGLVHLPGVTTLMSVEQAGQDTGSSSSSSCGDNSSRVDGSCSVQDANSSSSSSSSKSSESSGAGSNSSAISIAQAHEHAGSGLVTYADAQGLLTALLCEGQAQHTRSMPFLPLGSTLLTRHTLAQSGWTVVVLPWYEWATLTSHEDHIAYLAGKCIEADVHLQ